MKDAIAFMAWEQVVPWKILSLLVHPDEPLKPIGFSGIRFLSSVFLPLRRINP